MNSKIQFSTYSRLSSLGLGSARLHARIASRLSHGRTDLPSTARVAAKSNEFSSLWTPLRLDLLKAPLTRYRD